MIQAINQTFHKYFKGAQILPKKGDRLARPKSAKQSAGNSDWHRGLGTFTFGFDLAADIMFDILTVKHERDTVLDQFHMPALLWPTLYLVRHSIELALKEAIAQAEKALELKRTNISSHSLSKLSERFCDLVGMIAPKERQGSMPAFRSLIEEPNSYDPDGAAFRYSHDNAGRRYPFSGDGIHPREFKSSVAKLRNYIRCFGYLVADLRGLEEMRLQSNRE